MQSLTGRKKQTRQDIKIRRHGFWDKGVNNSAQYLSLPFDHISCVGKHYIATYDVPILM